MDEQSMDNPLTLKLGHEELIIRRRYEMISIINAKQRGPAVTK